MHDENGGFEEDLTDIFPQTRRSTFALLILTFALSPLSRKSALKIVRGCGLFYLFYTVQYRIVDPRFY